MLPHWRATPRVSEMPDETRQTAISTYIHSIPGSLVNIGTRWFDSTWLDIFLKLQCILEQMQIPIRLSLPWLMQMPWMHMQCTRNGRNVPVLAPCADLCACNAHVPALALLCKCIAHVTHIAPWERVTLTQTNHPMQMQMQRQLSLLAASSFCMRSISLWTHCYLSVDLATQNRIDSHR